MSWLPYHSHDDSAEKPHDLIMRRLATCLSDLADAGGLH